MKSGVRIILNMIKNIKIKKSYLISIIFFIIISFIAVYNNIISRPLKNNNDEVRIEVKEGDGFYDILDRMDSNNMLRSKFVIKLDFMMNKKSIVLNPGIHEVKTDISLNELVDSLQSAESNINTVKVTIPEGYSIEDIAQTMEDSNLCSKDEFIKAVKDYKLPDFIEENDNKRYNLEGFLYPDTYFIDKNADAEDIITIMVSRFKNEIDKLEESDNLVMDKEKLNKTITVASMIEKEASIDSDRPLISSVIYNRIDKDMKLQIDATVLYSLGYHVDKVYNKHLEVDSPYNTYKNKGIPIGPICSPGIKSIQAALYPKDTDYIYYILQEDGSHYFTDDYNDFLDKKKELGY